MKKEKTLTLKTLTKSNVWDIQENDVFRLWELAEKDADLKDNQRHYLDVIRSAFEIEPITVDKPEVIKKYEARGFKVGEMKLEDGENGKKKMALKKRPILRVTDLTYENIHHISATKLMEVLDRNFGGGWESLPQSIQDIIESGFDISTTTLPKDRLHKAGGLYEQKVNDGFEVLEIPKGTWIEAIFAKEKPELTKRHLVDFEEEDEEAKHKKDLGDSGEDDEEDLPEEDDHYNDEEDDDDTFDDDKLTEESYRTTYEENPEDLNLEAEDISDDEEY
ncbi:MAG: hypothetical protein PUD15_03295 [Prevotella sp.]|nr:hypothetical protein [Prevotella sp.]